MDDLDNVTSTATTSAAFEGPQLHFFSSIKDSIESSNDLGPHLGRLGLGQKFLDIIKNLLGSIDLSGMTKQQFLDVVGVAFDTFVAPLMTGQAAIFAPLVKALVLKIASTYYDNHSTPAPVPPVPVPPPTI